MDIRRESCPFLVMGAPEWVKDSLSANLAAFSFDIELLFAQQQLLQTPFFLFCHCRIVRRPEFVDVGGQLGPLGYLGQCGDGVLKLLLNPRTGYQALLSGQPVK